jgi:hypothetical protein
MTGEESGYNSAESKDHSMGPFETLLNCVFLVVGPCAAVWSVVSFVRTRNFIFRSVEVDGEVIRLERSKDRGQYGYTYAPVFSFTAEDGGSYTVTSDVGSSPAGFDVGDRVRVRYDPACPSSARIDTFFQTWGGPAIYAGIGVLFTCLACKALVLPHLTGN